MLEELQSFSSEICHAPGHASSIMARVRNAGRQITVADAGSTHGTYINGQRLSGPIEVRRGMMLQVGQTLLRFE